MATTSTIPTVKAQIVTILDAALAVPVSYAWPGPATAAEAVFLGRHPELDDIRVAAAHEVPTIKSGRQRRDETYTVPLTVWVFRPDLTATGAQTCEERAFVILGLVEDELADDPHIGLGQTIQFITLGDLEATLFPFQKGWAAEVVLQVNVRARLS